ncbi:phosphoribosylaminoimidazolesuccinocarboxamide synthase [Streptosporangium sp. NBC_01469]|uniref:phosphoribosylaminoimidazolesuccinocarboxamide synthase n=1 Tax=Streptosporangium sp. NBC_01469 TaxID=2903898 RepID=UPI002E2C4FF7|nr:phosphoribosylaminoimidazolesuccinocarboxamide synthase [Streptosporangium sp. NBC_01469]
MNVVNSVDLAILNTAPTLQGSVQQMYSIKFEGEDAFLCRALDVGSIFDVGNFFSIPESGLVRNSLRHAVFTNLADPVGWRALTRDDLSRYFALPEMVERVYKSQTLDRLRQEGVKTHHLGAVHPETGEVLSGAGVASDLVLIREYPVVRPVATQFLGSSIFDYHEYATARSKVLALEHVVRLGVAGGSWLLDQYRDLKHKGDESAAAEFSSYYGLGEDVAAWTALPSLACDWATKFEHYDRHLDLQEVLHISGISVSELNDVVDLVKLCTVRVEQMFSRAGLHLWDLKWEIAVDGSEVVVVDTMDQDSMRITGVVQTGEAACHVHFNKQSVRDYYRILHPDWHAALGDAKEISNRQATPGGFITVYNDGVAAGNYPPIPELDPGFASLQGRKYRYVLDAVQGQAEPGLGTELAREEVEFYRARNALDSFIKRNAATL